ncbi:MAG: hypothetical protein IKG23_11980 [Clostridia bacterium]|nr:hypothetical protein [Clostridia bacterium]
MNNKGVGAIFCLIASILMSTRYISAAVFMSGASSWSADLFKSGLSYVGPMPTIAGAIALGVGIFFLVLGLSRDK